MSGAAVRAPCGASSPRDILVLASCCSRVRQGRPSTGLIALVAGPRAVLCRGSQGECEHLGRDRAGGIQGSSR